MIMLVSITACFGQNQSDFSTSLEKFIEKKKDKLKVTGLSVALMIDDQVVLSKGFGFANKETGVAVDQSTQFAIGSISKMMTSTAVLKLYSEGKIDIDEAYSKYVPEFSMKQHFQGDKPFTVRHLLSHFAGLPRMHVKGFMIRNEQPQSRILELSKDDYLIAPPGVVNQYSDWGTDLLGVLIEKVSGQTIQEYIGNEVFGALEMNHSEYGHLTDTKSYINGSPTDTYEYSYAGSDGVNSTANDLMKLGQMYLNSGKSGGKQFLKAAIAKDAFTRQFGEASLAFDANQGLMWDILNFRKYTRISKGGIHEPFYSMLYVVPEMNMVLAVCSNSNSSSAIHRAVYGKVIDHLLAEGRGKSSNTRNALSAKIEPSPLSSAEMDKLEGTYSTDEGIVHLEKNKGKFKVTFSAQGKTVTGIPYSQQTIRLKAKILGIIPVHVMDIFWEEVNGEIVVGERYSSGARSLGGAKIDPNPIPNEWNKALGKYRVSNLTSDDYKNVEEIELKVNSYGLLQLNGKVLYPEKYPIQFALNPVSSSEAIIPGYSFEFFAGETIQLQTKNGRETLLVSGIEFTKVD